MAGFREYSEEHSALVIAGNLLIGRSAQ